ncbi:hypothetical protein, partial [Sinorhizobium meliloti]|uniref:hypothetical protein n=1 Tax=Rhizobium meliloti TaxID=382 RepID=UPI000FE0E968
MSGRKGATAFSEKHDRVKEAGRQFVRVPADEAEKAIPHLREKSALAFLCQWLAQAKELRTADELDPASELPPIGEQDLVGERFYDLPYRAPDEKLDFPEHPHFEEHGSYLSSGVAQHEVNWANSDVRLKGIAASQLNIFDSDEWAFECFGVLHISRDSVAKMVSYSTPSGYQRRSPILRPKLDAF